MGQSKLIIVSDEHSVVESARAFANHHSLELRAYSIREWNLKQSENNVGRMPSLSAGAQPVESGAKILQFPTGNQHNQNNGKVETINELESKAIKAAIFEYKGNLTEAAKALGIGRATLYRKVKQYNIDPNEARRRRAA